MQSKFSGKKLGIVYIKPEIDKQNETDDIRKLNESILSMGAIKWYTNVKCFIFVSVGVCLCAFMNDWWIEYMQNKCLQIKIY